MSWQLALQAIETFAVVVGVVFGLFQLRQLRLQREDQAGIELLRPLQSPEMAEAVILVHGLPDNLTGEELRKRLGNDFGSVMALMALFESLGPLVARGHIPVTMYAEFYRGVTVICWNKVRRFIEEQRQSGFPTLFEWVQWLAERMDERSPLATDVPAFERFRSWKRAEDFERLYEGSGTRHSDR